jgi:hypothetical protein
MCGGLKSESYNGWALREHIKYCYMKNKTMLAVRPP